MNQMGSFIDIEHVNFIREEKFMLPCAIAVYNCLHFELKILNMKQRPKNIDGSKMEACDIISLENDLGMSCSPCDKVIAMFHGTRVPSPSLPFVSGLLL